MKMSKAIIPSIIPFRAAALLLIDYEGAPFVPMKPLVEGMGLNWKTQRDKLASSSFRPLLTKIAVVTPTGKHRSMVCLPLRKLLGWLMTIDTDKVRLDLQQSIQAYRKSCDDVLWNHWLMGKPQYKPVSLCDEQVTDMAAEYLATYREAIVNAGGTLPTMDGATESRITMRLATLLLRDKRWLVTFNGNGDPQLMDVPADAGVFTPEKILCWIRENDGACLSFLPELLYALGNRLKTTF